MNLSYVAVKQFLDEQNYYYERDVLQPEGVPFIRFRQDLKSGGTVTVAIVFYDAYVKAMFLDVATINSISKRDGCYRMINRFNSRVNHLKFTYDENTGVISAEFTVLSRIFDGKMLSEGFMVMLAAFLRLIDEEVYPEIMKFRWS